MIDRLWNSAMPNGGPHCSTRIASRHSFDSEGDAPEQSTHMKDTADENQFL
jgi:hypothetical protein